MGDNDDAICKFLKANSQIVPTNYYDINLEYRSSDTAGDIDSQYFNANSSQMNSIYTYIDSVVTAGNGVLLELQSIVKSAFVMEINIQLSNRDSITQQITNINRIMKSSFRQLSSEINAVIVDTVGGASANSNIVYLLQSVNGINRTISYIIRFPSIVLCGTTKNKILEKLSGENCLTIYTKFNKLMTDDVIERYLIVDNFADIKIPVLFVKMNIGESNKLNAIDKYYTLISKITYTSIDIYDDEIIHIGSDGCIEYDLLYSDIGQFSTLQPYIEYVCDESLAIIETHKHQYNHSRLYYESMLIDSCGDYMSDVLFLKAVLEMLYPEGSDRLTRESWIMIIKSLANSSVKYYMLSKWLSAGTSFYEEFEWLWNGIFDKTIDLSKYINNEQYISKKYIIHQALIYNKATLDKIRATHIRNLLIHLIEIYEGKIEHNNMAIICYFKFYEYYITDDIAQNKYIWYRITLNKENATNQYSLYKWRIEDKPQDIQLYIKSELSQIMINLRDEYIVKARQKAREHEINKVDLKNSDKSDIDKAILKKKPNELLDLELIVKNLKLSVIKLQNQTFCNSCIEACVDKFYMHGFTDMLNKERSIFPLANGILKFVKGCLSPDTQPKNTQLVFIDNYHEYPVTKFSDVVYIPKIVSNIQMIVNKMIGDIFTEECARIKILTFMALGLDWDIKQLPMLILYGCGANGKSTALKIWRGVFGLLGINSPLSLIVAGMRDDSTKANSALVSLAESRINVYSEPNSSEVLNPARLKDVNGQEQLSMRQLYGKQITAVVNSVQILGTNFDIIIDTTDHGTWRRIMLYTCKTVFTNKPLPENKYERQVNEQIIGHATSDPLYLSAFLNILIEHYLDFYNKYDGKLDNIISPVIDMETQQYRNRQDIINEYITKYIISFAQYCEVFGGTVGDMRERAGEVLTIEFIANQYISYLVNNKNIKVKTPINSVITQFENSALKHKFKTLGTSMTKILEDYIILKPEEVLIYSKYK